MCGICGVIEKDRINSEILLTMATALKHRGPDNINIKIVDNVGLGHARLSIIDLSESANQPMSNENDSIWLVYNGEFYTFQEYREFLLKKGHKFRSNTDSEVILHLYEEYGMDFVTCLRGMFAIAILDLKKNKLILLRDRVGIKPLFYYYDGSKFLFASEIKAILQYPGIIKDMDLDSLQSYFTLGYIPGGNSIYDKIKKLPPAHVLTFHNHNVEINRYWSLPSTIIFKDENTAREELESLLLESVKMRMISDVPLGVLLSGGIDSSLVASLMAHLSNDPIKTFSISFNEDKFNEINYARSIARHISSEHYEYKVDLAKSEIIEDLIYYYDEPFADSSAIPTYYVSKMAKEHVTVVLSGDGGDELFAGYNWYDWMHKQQYIKGKYSALSKFIPFLSGSIPIDFKGKHFIKSLSLDEFDTFYERTTLFTEQELKELLKIEFHLDFKKGYRNRYYKEGNTLFQRLTRTDFELYLPDDILTKVDRSSMANGLEARVPLLDHKVCEFAFSLDDDLKIRNNQRKYLLKQIASKWLPTDFDFTRKQGFSIPQSEWLKSRYHDRILDLLPHDNFLNKPYIRRLLKDHKGGVKNNSKKLWPILIFLIWREKNAGSTIL
jgi:asparagine synthase (glutamine-hydrolysing)